jgi:release factor glutamine methyltransferase
LRSPSKTLRLTQVLWRTVKLDRSIDIEVSSEVYNPSDDSYLLLRSVEVSPGQTLLEMGSGSGLLSVHAAKLGASVTAVDISPEAVECTRRNANKNGVRVNARVSDLFQNVSGYFDVIAFNPPYLPSEARSTSWIEMSWSGGEEGSETTVAFLGQAWQHLAPGGRIYLVLSSIGGLMSVLKAAKVKYECEMLEEVHQFFESVYAYKLWPRHFQE